MGSLESSNAQDTLGASFAYGKGVVTTSHRKRPLRTFLFGHHLHGSMAPLLHETLFRAASLPWTYTIHDTADPSGFLPALKQEDTIGCAVTMPYKVSMMSAVDDVTPEARVIGAINTVFLRTGEDNVIRHIGTNTDCIGVREAFIQNYPDVLSQSTGRPALVIGGGGACRAAIYALWTWLGASEIYIVNRLEAEATDMINNLRAAGFPGKLTHVKTVEQAVAAEAPFLAVGTIPDFTPKEAGEILAREVVEELLGKPQKGILLEMCYHPRPRTQLFALAEEKGWEVICGTEAMIWQGVAQQILWSELPLETFDVRPAQEIIRQKLKEKESASLL